MTTTATAEPAPAAPAQIEWNLAEIYDSLDAWRADKARLEQAVEGLARFKGRLGESAATLSEALDAISATEKDLVRLYVFAFLKADEDRRVSEAQERRGEATLLLAAFEEATSFVSPELLRVGSETIKGYLDAEPRLARHARLQRAQHPAQGAAHALGRSRGGHRRHERDAAGARAGIRDAHQLGHAVSDRDAIDRRGGASRPGGLRQAPRLPRSRGADRKRVFDAFWKAWKGYTATLGQTLDTHVKAHVFEARSRRYDSALDAALAGPNIPAGLYRTLVAAANRHLPSLHRYFGLRRRMLGLPVPRMSGAELY